MIESMSDSYDRVQCPRVHSTQLVLYLRVVFELLF